MKLTDIDGSVLLRVKLGHQRMIQRKIDQHMAIDEWGETSRGSDELAASDQQSHGAQDSHGGHSSPVTGGPQSGGGIASVAQRTDAPRAKRAYHRHPKNDENAPPLPPTQYNLFAKGAAAHISCPRVFGLNLSPP
jgi:hypothetical protein